MASMLDQILDLYLPGFASDKRRSFARLGEADRQSMVLSFLVQEFAAVLEAYLHHRNGDRRKGQGAAGAELLRLNALLGALGRPKLEVGHGRGAKLIASIWEQIAGPVADGGRFTHREEVELPRAPAFQPHLASAVGAISQVFRDAGDGVLAFGYHGSIASQDHIPGLSDCDAILLLRAGLLGDDEKLKKVQSACQRALALMQRIDAFQHHGVFVVPEELFACYPENYFPTVLYQTSAFDLGAGTRLELRVLESRAAAAIRVLRWSRFLEHAAPNMAGYDYDHFHEVLQVAQVLPCFVAACCDRSMNKREAIPWLIAHCPNTTAEFLQATGELRACWGDFWSSRNLGAKVLGGRFYLPLRDKIVEFFGGAGRLQEALLTLAGDSSRMALASLGQKK